ncbi:class I SAM-dependent methyltransferase [Winogradskyella jejuensis]|uniref:Methyltransferase domain-containing protein n=1 Tax=Winogradskyella jejuensis TaxID=1089305 RepID=A0A1M5K819_9FLAO|nr:class I SAM-dependent methyltransferase [Winogradskyella jejuensis]SHG48982.1 Methyltransferase domain-containing protein [Winogradskyella jejuensis]
MEKDIFGKALLDHQSGNYSEDIITWTNISDKDELPLPYLFRDYSEMPKLEQKALQLTKGKVLDVGCGSGSHTLYLQDKGFKVKGIDSSKGAIEVAKQRGVLNAECVSLLDYSKEQFDTILLLMNGTGIFQEVQQVASYLKHLKSLLKPNGQILIDSSDIKYMYEDEDGGTWIDLSGRYYGELDYYLSYKGEEETPMKWLYLDFEMLKTACQTVGFHCEKVIDGKHFDYLARIY